MMLKIFGEYESPFYKFGDMMFLPKISRENWIEYIGQRFSRSGKSIPDSVAGHIADLMENHPYYVQQLAQYSWLRTESACSTEIVNAAFQSMLDSMSLQYVNIMDNLTEKQRNFLCAISDGVRKFTSSQTLAAYKLGTSTNIQIMKKALKSKDLIEETGNTLSIQDPVFNKWIHNTYKKM